MHGEIKLKSRLLGTPGATRKKTLEYRLMLKRIRTACDPYTE